MHIFLFLVQPSFYGIKKVTPNETDAFPLVMNSKCYNTQMETIPSSIKKELLKIPDFDYKTINHKIINYDISKMKVLKCKRIADSIKFSEIKPETVSDMIKYARLAAGLTIKNLAEIVDVSKSTIIRYENSEVFDENMDLELLKKIALACNMDKLFCCNKYHIFLLSNPGQQLKDFRKSQKITQKQFALKLNVSVKTIKCWESNKNRPPVFIWKSIFDSYC